MKPQTTFASVLTRFFTQRLMEQRHASPHTIHSYRDTFRLLLQFAKSRLGKEPSQLAWEAIDGEHYRIVPAALTKLDLMYLSKTR